MGTSFLWLEITGRCQLQCVHCYAESGPDGTHGTMTGRDWVRVLDHAVHLDVQMVQFIGGEPTLYPGLAGLVEHALGCGLQVEVFSNLVHISDELWEVFSRPGVSLATSYYSDDPDQHAAVTARPSYGRTKANIAEAVRRGIPLRAGVIDLGRGQRAEAAQAELVGFGVPSVGYDRLRQVGRGVRDRQASVEQLCGHCGDGVAALSPDGAVWPCVFSRWLSVGNVLEQELAEILDSPEAHRVRAELARAFAARATPAVLDVVEWDDSGRRVRAELMTLAPGTRVSADMALRRHVDLDDEWWNELRSSLDTLAVHPTDRVCLDEQFVQRRLLGAFGVELDTARLTCSTAHGDVHWANITAPRCWLLDWESWGSAPTGYDAALLLCTSLLQPEITERVRAVFADVLDTFGGQVAQLLAAAKLLGLVEYGDHPDLAVPVHRHARAIVDQISARH